MYLDLTALAQALDSEQAHTSFGKLPLSVEKSQAQFSFPQANRWDGCKKFDAELTRTENIGKNAPGPQYMYQDKIKYGEVSHKSVRARSHFWATPPSETPPL
jgi:hypothetical protein